MGLHNHRLVLLRHGETEWSKSGQHTGRTEVELTDAGRTQAKLAGTVLGELKLVDQLVISSPRRRSLTTAELAGLSVDEVSELLAEWDYGSYEGLTDAEVHRERPDWSLFRDGAPGGESPQEVEARIERVLAALREAPGPAILFSHGKTLRALAARWLGCETAFGERLPLDAAAVGILDAEDGRPVLQAWNWRPSLV